METAPAVTEKQNITRTILEPTANLAALALKKKQDTTRPLREAMAMQLALEAITKQDTTRPLREAMAMQVALEAITKQDTTRPLQAATAKLGATVPIMIFPSPLLADTLPTKSPTVVSTIRYSAITHRFPYIFKLTTFSGQQI
jgi:hypothetical protein